MLKQILSTADLLVQREPKSIPIQLLFYNRCNIWLHIPTLQAQTFHKTFTLWLLLHSVVAVKTLFRTLRFTSCLKDILIIARYNQKRAFPFVHLLFTCFINICNIGEKVVALRFGHCEAQLPGIFKHADQNLQAQQVRMLRRYHFKYGLRSRGVKEKGYFWWGWVPSVCGEKQREGIGCKLKTVTRVFISMRAVCLPLEMSDFIQGPKAILRHLKTTANGVWRQKCNTNGDHCPFVLRRGFSACL